MPQAYKNAKARSVQATLVAVLTAPVSVGAQVLVQSIHVCALSTAPEIGGLLTVSWTDASDAGSVTILARDFPVDRNAPPVNLLDRPLTLEAGDALRVQGSFPNTTSALCDVTVSYLEIT